MVKANLLVESAHGMDVRYFVEFDVKMERKQDVYLGHTHFHSFHLHNNKLTTISSLRHKRDGRKTMVVFSTKPGAGQPALLLSRKEKLADANLCPVVWKESGEREEVRCGTKLENDKKREWRVGRKKIGCSLVAVCVVKEAEFSNNTDFFVTLTEKYKQSS